MKKLILSLLLALGCALAQAQVTNFVTTPLASAAQTAGTVNSADQTNYLFSGGHFVINISAYTSGTYTPHIQGKDPVSGAYYDILVGTALNSAGTTVLKVYPGIGALANGSASDVLPQTWRVQLIGGSSPSMTISVAAYLER